MCTVPFRQMCGPPLRTDPLVFGHVEKDVRRDRMNTVPAIVKRLGRGADGGGIGQSPSPAHSLRGRP